MENNILYIEPRTIADWKEDMILSEQLFSPRTYSIRLLHVLLTSDEKLEDDAIEVIEKNLKDYPELRKEVERDFPHVKI